MLPILSPRGECRRDLVRHRRPGRESVYATGYYSVREFLPGPLMRQSRQRGLDTRFIGPRERVEETADAQRLVRGLDWR